MRPTFERWAIVAAALSAVLAPSVHSQVPASGTAASSAKSAPGQRAMRQFEKHAVEGQPIDSRPFDLDTDHAVFPGQTHAPFHRTTAIRTTVIASGLKLPWAVAQLPSGRFIITEKPGHIRILNADGTDYATIANLPPIFFRAQVGLLDLALDRNFATTRRLFFTYMRDVDAGNCALAVASGILDESKGTLSDIRTIFQTATYPKTTAINAGSRIAVDPADGTLFVTIGDRSTSAEPVVTVAQRTDTYLGKLIHITPDGKPAPGNPKLGLPEIYTLGHRSEEGLAFAPDHRLWEVEDGPRGGDELNLIVAGRNYGWPVIVHGVNYTGNSIGQGIVEKAGMVQPRYFWDPPISPSGLVFYRGALFPQWRRSVLMGALTAQALYRLELGRDDRVVNEEALLTNLNQRIRDVRVFGDGAVYVLTDSMDGQLIRITAG